MRRWLAVVGVAVLVLWAIGFQGPITQPRAKGGEKVYLTMSKDGFGKTPDGAAVDVFELTNKDGIRARIITYGAILTELHVPDRNGNSTDVVLGFDDLEGYLKGHPYFGATVGRVANRIAKGRFTLDGETYDELPITKIATTG